MQENEELRRIKDEIRKLEEERSKLLSMREAKIRRLQLLLENVPRKLEAEHPIMTGALELAGRGAKEAAKGTAHGIKSVVGLMADYLRYAKMHPNSGWVGYLQYRREKERKPLKV